MEAIEKSQYLGKEKLNKLIIKFSLPCILSLLISSLYNIIDQIFIGNSELSALGNAATGVVFPIFIIAQAFAWCFGDGCSAYLNICQGRRTSENAHKAIGTGLVLTLIISCVLLAVFFPLKSQILTLFGASEQSIGYAIEYFDWILAFFPIFMLSNMMNPIIRADGAPGWAMFAMVFGAVTNIILDPVFIYACGWGMAGAAIATVIGQTASFVISVIYFCRTKTFKLTLKSFIVNVKNFLPALKLGISSFITQIVIVIISLVCNIMLVKYGMTSNYGVDVPIAIIAVESKVFTVVINIVVGIVLGCQPIISYNMGAKNYDRIRELYKKILFCTIIIGLIATLIFEIFPEAMVGMFGTPSNIPNPDAYWEFGVKTFRIFLSLVTFTCIEKITSIFFQSAGKPFKAVISSMVRDLLCFVPLIIVLPMFMGIDGILIAAPISDVVSMVLVISLTVSFMKSLRKEEKEQTVESVIKPSKAGVIITISREHGTNGKQIGKVVAERLNIPYYYKEMTALAAQESGLDKNFISDINANAPAILHSLYLSTDVVQQAITAQDQIIKKIADNGSCVIVGRAADYVLREYDNVVKIFIHAPEDYKVKTVMNVYGDSEEDAIRNVKRSDTARASYYKNISGEKWGKTENYDLCIDASIGIDASAELILKYVENK
ncbi:MAG: MATE family efflux transporter [Clostridiales bacterium]|nr:MATE family efflux transporter [Clostridiales bacterium]